MTATDLDRRLREHRITKEWRVISQSIDQLLEQDLIEDFMQHGYHKFTLTVLGNFKLAAAFADNEFLSEVRTDHQVFDLINPDYWEKIRSAAFSKYYRHFSLCREMLNINLDAESQVRVFVRAITRMDRAKFESMREIYFLKRLDA